MAGHDEEIRILKKVFRDNNIDIVFDVGANNGIYASRLRKEVGYDGYIVSYEPIPELAENMKKSGDPKWIVIEAALGEEEGNFQFFQTSDSQFSSFNKPYHGETKIFNNMNREQKVLNVQSKTLTDEFLRLHAELGFNRPFLKVDTQGHDISVIRGGLAIINTFVAFQSELNVTRIYEKYTDFRQALFFYESLGFAIGALFLPNIGHFPKLIDIDVVMVNPRLYGK